MAFWARTTKNLCRPEDIEHAHSLVKKSVAARGVCVTVGILSVGSFVTVVCHSNVDFDGRYL